MPDLVKKEITKATAESWIPIPSEALLALVFEEYSRYPQNVVWNGVQYDKRSLLHSTGEK